MRNNYLSVWKMDSSNYNCSLSRRPTIRCERHLLATQVQSEAWEEEKSRNLSLGPHEGRQLKWGESTGQDNVFGRRSLPLLSPLHK